MNSNAALVAGLKAGDEQAQKVFWDRYYGEMLLICAHILGSGPDAVDITVDLMTDFMFTYVHKLSHANAAPSYLRLMAARRSIRHSQKRRAVADLDMNELPDDAGIDPEEAAGYAFLMPRLEECLSELTPKAQQVLRLKYTHQLTNERIGALIGSSKQYIGRLIRRSLESLRACLERRGKDPETGSQEV